VQVFVRRRGGNHGFPPSRTLHPPRGASGEPEDAQARAVHRPPSEEQVVRGGQGGGRGVGAGQQRRRGAAERRRPPPAGRAGEGVRGRTPGGLRDAPRRAVAGHPPGPARWRVQTSGTHTAAISCMSLHDVDFKAIKKCWSCRSRSACGSPASTTATATRRGWRSRARS
jgi:hypothetical protein